MTVLITGATGFVGSRIAHALLTTRNQQVVALGRGEPSALRDRVVAPIRLQGDTDSVALQRLRCVSGDVTLPWLGLTPALHARLAGQVDAVWHCAGDIALAGERERLFRVNTQGTAHVLAFLDQTRPACRLVHVSTMAVAGNRPAGLVLEDDLTDVHGFVTHYDASKYAAEQLVRRWAARRARPALVLRPGVVASDRPLPDSAAEHPLAQLGKMIKILAEGGAPGIPPEAERPRGTEMRLRINASPSATFNIVPSDYATEAMVRIGCDTPRADSGVRTYHIVHPTPTRLADVLRVLERHHAGLRLECAEEFDGASVPELFIARHLTGFISYCRLQHRYDRTHALADTPGLPEPAPVDARFLQRALGFDALPASPPG
ncbi:SDR family oxidoreductase [Streptomyces sp. CNQ085]|uniref:SDR family oxidoreductase n=1 Tax=Streptomyces sp. CNQ085 TaxID=2886944 RepID=UPI001F507544|nr:SDR family oxidoreductase [Streptomyces sp. CNQ085]MCI0384155.1 SDR family oxidoreductase [Streptomyces sp. CNQ085]